jgi:hypothetical protein
MDALTEALLVFAAPARPPGAASSPRWPRGHGVCATASPMPALPTRAAGAASTRRCWRSSSLGAAGRQPDLTLWFDLPASEAAAPRRGARARPLRARTWPSCVASGYAARCASAPPLSRRWMRRRAVWARVQAVLRHPMSRCPGWHPWWTRRWPWAGPLLLHFFDCAQVRRPGCAKRRWPAPGMRAGCAAPAGSLQGTTTPTCTAWCLKPCASNWACKGRCGRRVTPRVAPGPSASPAGRSASTTCAPRSTGSSRPRPAGAPRWCSCTRPRR